MYAPAGDWALRESFPEKDSGVAKELRAHGVVILGKAGLSSGRTARAPALGLRERDRAGL